MPEYDNGGILSAGVCVAVNATGSPEQVLSAEEWRILRGRES